ncbi:MAG TPA: ribonuclease P protein component [Jatrophihabitans sp.]|nr:ribonuclease P protein component [Jatrophihabitans sp.]
MLPAPHRMRRSADFARALRAGQRARRGCLVVHQQRESGPDDAPALVGLIVSKAVGGSVVRHRVSRRLRAQVAHRVDQLPPASRTVVRALPAAAQAPSAQLGADLDRALRSLTAAQ